MSGSDQRVRCLVTNPLPFPLAREQPALLARQRLKAKSEKRKYSVSSKLAPVYRILEGSTYINSFTLELCLTKEPAKLLYVKCKPKYRT